MGRATRDLAAHAFPALCALRPHFPLKIGNKTLTRAYKMAVNMARSHHASPALRTLQHLPIEIDGKTLTRAYKTAINMACSPHTSPALRALRLLPLEIVVNPARSDGKTNRDVMLPPGLHYR